MAAGGLALALAHCSLPFKEVGLHKLLRPRTYLVEFSKLHSLPGMLREAAGQCKCHKWSWGRERGALVEDMAILVLSSQVLELPGWNLGRQSR